MVSFDCPFPANECNKQHCIRNCFPCLKPVVDYMVLYLESLKGGSANGKKNDEK